MVAVKISYYQWLILESSDDDDLTPNQRALRAADKAAREKLLAKGEDMSDGRPRNKSGLDVAMNPNGKYMKYSPRFRNVNLEPIFLSQAEFDAHYLKPVAKDGGQYGTEWIYHPPSKAYKQINGWDEYYDEEAEKADNERKAAARKAAHDNAIRAYDFADGDLRGHLLAQHRGRHLSHKPQNK